MRCQPETYNRGLNRDESCNGATARSASSARKTEQT